MLKLLEIESSIAKRLTTDPDPERLYINPYHILKVKATSSYLHGDRSKETIISLVDGTVVHTHIGISELLYQIEECTRSSSDPAPRVRTTYSPGVHL